MKSPTRTPHLASNRRSILVEILPHGSNTRDFVFCGAVLFRRSSVALVLLPRKDDNRSDPHPHALVYLVRVGGPLTASLEHHRQCSHFRERAANPSFSCHLWRITLVFVEIWVCSSSSLRKNESSCK